MKMYKQERERETMYECPLGEMEGITACEVTHPHCHSHLAL